MTKLLRVHRPSEPGWYARRSQYKLGGTEWVLVRKDAQGEAVYKPADGGGWQPVRGAAGGAWWGPAEFE